MDSKQGIRSLIELYSHPPVNRVSEFGDFAEQLDVPELIEEYEKLVRVAPHRHERGEKYFVAGHDLFLGHWQSTRKEEHVAGALFNACQYGETFPLPNAQELKIIDYQFPLKARQGDKGIGKVDLFGVLDKTVPTVIELKVSAKKGSKPDTPLRAFLEGLAYCAIVEANMKDIAEEAQAKFDLQLHTARPDLMVLAPDDYWFYYSKNKSAGHWSVKLKTLVERIFREMNLSVHFLSIKNVQLEWGGHGKPARLKGRCKFNTVEALNFEN